MAAPDWKNGEELSADDVNEWLLLRAAYKDSDTDRSSTTSPSNDPDLQISIPDSGLFMFLGFLVYTGPVGANFKWTWNLGSTGAVINTGAIYYNTGNTLLQEFQIATDTHAAYTAGTGISYRRSIVFQGFMNAGDSSGTMILQWSQASSNGTAVSLKQNSYLALYRIES